MKIIQDHSQHLKIVTKNYMLYVGRVLHPPLSRITVMPNLMQGSVRDFSISLVKTIPQNKILWCVVKKNKENQGHSVDKQQYAMGGESVHKCVGFRNFWCTQE